MPHGLTDADLGSLWRPCPDLLARAIMEKGNVHPERSAVLQAHEEVSIGGNLDVSQCAKLRTMISSAALPSC